MAPLSNSTKGKLGLAAAGTALKHPGATAKASKFAAKAAAPAAKGGLKVTKAIGKRKAGRSLEDLGEAARGFLDLLAVYAPEAAQALGWVEPPKPKRTAPRVLVGVVIGAAAMYLLEPGTAGREHRAQVAKLFA